MGQLNRTLIVKNWGLPGVDLMEEIAARHGLDKVPEPIEKETLEQYARRAHAMGLIHVAGDHHVLGNVVARRKAEADGLPIFEVTDEPDTKLDAASAALRALPPHERLVQYRSTRDELLSTDND